jgi:processive 1,2-diacylglycerol beta-glucosyltransferase
LIKKLNLLNFEAQVLVVAGINKRLLGFLKKVKSKHKIHAFGYTDNIDKLMSVADILVTKPGGVTAAEALAKNLPMLIMKPLPGQEQNNTNFLLKQGVVEKAESVEDAVKKLNSLLSNRERLLAIKREIPKIAHPASAIKIAELALSLC